MSKITDDWWGGKTHWLWDNVKRMNKRPDLIILDDMEENMAENINASASNGFTISATPDNFYGPGLVGSLTKMWHQVKIDKVANGFIVEIGCKKFVDTDWDKLSKKLGEYWKDPVAAEKKYCK